jgi:hypothetical protein
MIRVWNDFPNASVIIPDGPTRRGDADVNVEVCAGLY